VWQRIYTLIAKELLAVWRNRHSRVILIVPPVIQMLVFSFAATQEVKNVRMGVLNRDQGTVSRDLIARFEGSPNFAEVRRFSGPAELARAVDAQQVLIVLDIRSDFSRELAARQVASVQLILDGRRSNAAQIVAGYATDIVDRFNRELTESRRGLRPPSLVVGRVWFNPNLLATWNSVPSLVAVLTTLMGLVVTALSVARERELGTFDQLLVSPLEPIEIVAGKTIPALLIGLAEGTLMLAVGVFAFRIPFQGSIPVLYASMAVYLVAVVGVGLFISSLARTQQQAYLGTFAFMVPAILLSGFASPIENMPDWLQAVTLLNPARYYVTIVKGLFLKGMTLSMVLQLLWPVALIGMATLTGATLLFRHRIE
jgi:ABC-2 type transport system permease protein